jgi:hypothetical protein
MHVIWRYAIVAVAVQALVALGNFVAKTPPQLPQPQHQPNK